MATIRVNEQQLRHFRSKARDSKFEIMAYLVGQVESADLVVIDYFAYTKEYGTQSPSEVAWTWQEYDRVYKQAEERGRRIVGYIHSHPEWDAVMSPDDHLICLSEGARICGIVSVLGRRTRVRFWIPDSALPCEVEYVKKIR